jgi:hypothetical protein
MLAWAACVPNVFLRRTGYLPDTHVHVYVTTSDCSSDKAAARKIIAQEINGMPRVLFWDMNCLLHQNNLMVKDGLQHIGNCLSHFSRSFDRYFGNLVKITNV